MAQQTEAACLMTSGSAYRRRAGLQPESGDLIFAGFKPGGFSIYFGDEPIYHVDLEGRWQRAYFEGIHYLKALDASVDAIERVREGENLVLRRRRLSFAEAGDLDARIRSTAVDLIESLGSESLQLVAPPAPAWLLGRYEIQEMLEKIAAWDAAAWFRHRETYLGTYGPLPFLPPSCPRPVILQATLGHPDGRAFGGADPAEPYVRSETEFEEHVRTVAELLGRRVAQAKGVVLCGGDWLRQPIDRIASQLDIASKVFSVQIEEGSRPRLSNRPEDSALLDGFYAFLDDLSAPLPEPDGWRQLRDRHLKRVDIGVESGDAGLRGLFGTTWDDDALPRTVADMKQAGLEVGVVLLVGVGGKENAERHVDASTRRLLGLNLGAGDIVYLVDADDVGGPSSRERLRRQGLTPLTVAERSAQREAIRARLNPLRAEQGVKVVPYSLEKQERL